MLGFLDVHYIIEIRMYHSFVLQSLQGFRMRRAQ